MSTLTSDPKGDWELVALAAAQGKARQFCKDNVQLHGHRAKQRRRERERERERGRERERDR